MTPDDIVDNLERCIRPSDAAVGSWAITFSGLSQLIKEESPNVVLHIRSLMDLRGTRTEILSLSRRLRLADSAIHRFLAELDKKTE
jgi:hypothetical protein